MKLAMITNICILACGWRQEDEEFKFILGYTVSLRPAKATWDLVSKQQWMSTGKQWVLPMSQVSSMGSTVQHLQKDQ